MPKPKFKMNGGRNWARNWHEPILNQEDIWFVWLINMGSGNRKGSDVKGRIKQTWNAIWVMECLQTSLYSQEDVFFHKARHLFNMFLSIWAACHRQACSLQVCLSHSFCDGLTSGVGLRKLLEAWLSDSQCLAQLPQIIFAPPPLSARQKSPPPANSWDPVFFQVIRGHAGQGFVFYHLPYSCQFFMFLPVLWNFLPLLPVSSEFFTGTITIKY